MHWVSLLLTRLIFYGYLFLDYFEYTYPEAWARWESVFLAVLAIGWLVNKTKVPIGLKAFRNMAIGASVLFILTYVLQTYNYILEPGFCGMATQEEVQSMFDEFYILRDNVRLIEHILLSIAMLAYPVWYWRKSKEH